MSEAKARELLQACADELAHVRVFVTSREKMHPDGVKLFVDLRERIAAYLAAVPAPPAGPPRVPTEAMLIAGDRAGCTVGQQPSFEAVEAIWRAMYDAAPAAEPAQPAEPADDYVFAVAQELVRVACERICDDVTAIARGRGSDPECKTQSYWAGHESACEEVKHRVGAIAIPLLPNVGDAAPAAEPVAQPEDQSSLQPLPACESGGECPDKSACLRFSQCIFSAPQDEPVAQQPPPCPRCGGPTLLIDGETHCIAPAAQQPPRMGMPEPPEPCPTCGRYDNANCSNSIHLHWTAAPQPEAPTLAEDDLVVRCNAEAERLWRGFGKFKGPTAGDIRAHDVLREAAARIESDAERIRKWERAAEAQEREIGLLGEMLDASREREWSLQAAVRDLFAETDWPEGGELDGFAFQEWATKHGFLRPEERMSFCAEDCNCAEYHGDASGGFTCYRKAEWLIATPDSAASPTGGEG